MRTVKQYLTFGGGTPFQAAVAHALAECMPWVNGQRERLQHKRDLLLNGLRAGEETGRPRRVNRGANVQDPVRAEADN